MLEVLEQLRKPQATFSRLRKAIGAPPRELSRALDALEARGEIVRSRSDRVSLPRTSGLVTGRVSLGRRGSGVVVPDEPGPPLKLAKGNARPALDGDLVLVAPAPFSRHGLREAKVRKVLERRRTHVVGVPTARDKRRLLPQDGRLAEYVIVLSEDSPPAPAGHAVNAEIVEYPTSWRDLVVRVVEDLGPAGTLPTEIHAILRGAGIATEFPEACLAEARAASPPGEDELAQRHDLRERAIFTIDPADAKDHDDAVAIEARNRGWTLTVAIADVAHYVLAGSALDHEARDRATSVYLPGTVVPMLPHELSSDLASLRPGVDRLVVAAEIDVEEDGTVTEARFHRAVLRSRAKLSYEEAQAILDGETLVDVPEEVRASLGDMRRLAEALLARRLARGAVDLDLPEARVLVDEDGNPTGIARRERLFAHRLIEEFMLAANEAVARHLERRKAPFLYRIHERPAADSIDGLARRLAPLGLRLKHDGARITPLILKEPLAAAAGQPFERQVNLMILRSMTQARYSAEKEIHFGLASESYCHFTSPIRRYPDLVVHRALLAELGLETGLLPRGAALADAAEHCSARERRAMDAERDAIRAAAAILLLGRVGETFEGTVASVERWGYTVELDEIFVEGFVHIGRHHEYLDFIAERMELVSRTSSFSVRIGDRIRVRLESVDLTSRSIELSPRAR